MRRRLSIRPAIVASLAALVAVALVASSCAGSSGESPAGAAAPTVASQPSSTFPARVGDEAVPPHTLVLESTTTTAPPWAPTTTAPLAVPTPANPVVCPGESDTASTGPEPTAMTEARNALAPAVNDRRFANSALSVSVWVDGWGELADLNQTRTYPPASNQKLLTAAGVYERLDVNEKTHTTVIATGPTVDGVVKGDLILVGGGDPTVTRSGVRSLDALASQIKAKGVIEVEGRLLVDESRYDTERSVPSWPQGWQSTVGSLSALVVDRNRSAGDDPALTGAGWFKDSLATAGVKVDGEVEHGTADEGVQVAVLDGPTYGEIVVSMLQNSDNLAAELVVKEIGRRHTGVGSTADGLASIRDATAVLCVPPGGGDVDGSGFSASDAHSTHQLRRLLQVAARRTWGPRFKGSLAVAGQVGTLVGRLIGPRTTGNVRAKTGSIAVSKALSGYVTTAGGRQAYFSIIVNGNATGGLEPAIDDIVATIAAFQG